MVVEAIMENSVLDKNKLLFWSILENKVSTWDVLQKRCFVGSIWCCFCREDVESAHHLFLGCPFSQQVWSEVISLLNLRSAWSGNSVEEALSSWWRDEGAQNHKAAPLIINWGIWIARNEVIFNGRSFSPSDIASKASGILLGFRSSYQETQCNPREYR